VPEIDWNAWAHRDSFLVDLVEIGFYSSIASLTIPQGGNVPPAGSAGPRGKAMAWVKPARKLGTFPWRLETKWSGL